LTAEELKRIVGVEATKVFNSISPERQIDFDEQ
jgi:hypothetical protein